MLGTGNVNGTKISIAQHDRFTFNEANEEKLLNATYTLYGSIRTTDGAFSIKIEDEKTMEETFARTATNTNERIVTQKISFSYFNLLGMATNNKIYYFLNKVLVPLAVTLVGGIIVAYFIYYQKLNAIKDDPIKSAATQPKLGILKTEDSTAALPTINQTTKTKALKTKSEQGGNDNSINVSNGTLNARDIITGGNKTETNIHQ